VSSSVDHDAKVTKPLPDEQLNNMDRIFEGTTNLSNGISFHGAGVTGSNVTEEHHEATPTNASSHPNAIVPKINFRVIFSELVPKLVPKSPHLVSSK
jgi:hypothetical protein